MSTSSRGSDDAVEGAVPRQEATASGHGRTYQAGRDIRFLHLTVPRAVGNVAVIVVVVGLLVGGAWFGWERVRPMFAPAYKTQFLIDTAVAADGPEAVADSLKKAVGNAGDHDALALRAFGGECGAPDNTAQLVGFGTGNREKIGRAAAKIRQGGKSTLVRGIVQAVEDFSQPLGLGAGQPAKRVNRIIVVTRHGADACEDDAAFVQREIQDRIASAGLTVDFKVIGYQVPDDQRARLEQIAAGVRAGDPVFARDPAQLNAALEWFTNVRPVFQESKKITDALNPAVDQVEAARTAIDEGRFDSARRNLDRAGSVNITGALEDLRSRAKTPQVRDIYRRSKQLGAQQRRVVAAGRDLLDATRARRSRDTEFAAYLAAVKTYNEQADALKNAQNALRATAPGARP